MNFAIKVPLLTVFACCYVLVPANAQELRETVLRNAAIQKGLTLPQEVNVPYETAKAEIGAVLFESDLLSFNSDTSCRSCHLPQFSSGDGLPNAVGTGGVGEGRTRLMSDGAIVPRNALPLWGRGGKGFESFFWDGKVHRDKETGTISSQFGMVQPSDDPLIIAIHLPFVEIDEMVDETTVVNLRFKTETAASATAILDELTERIHAENSLAEPLSAAYAIAPASLTFNEIADSIAHFIRREFRIRETRFHNFVLGDGVLTKQEIAGGLVFYGKGGCAQCHNGPYFTDFEFHAIPFPQSGFGKNGFGVDYGRYNVTFDPADLYHFRTPPLYNVEFTSPYSHSGSVATLEEAILAHVDPLFLWEKSLQQPDQRQSYYHRLRAWADEPVSHTPLDEDDISNLKAFLRTLTFCEPDLEDYCPQEL